MSRKKELTVKLEALDDLFSTQEQREDESKEKVMEIAISEISDFPGHPFHVKQDAEMERLIESIKQNGVLVPALVRPKENGKYEMIAGHRRKFASGIAEKDSIPCIVRDLTDDEATIIMVDSNLQRENLLPSEKGFAYRMKLEAMKRQGKRTDLTSVQVAQKLNGKTSREILAGEVGESQDQVRRYIRLTYLIPKLLQKVDEGKIAMTPAVEISYIPVEIQKILLDVMESEDCTPSYAQTRKMRKLLESENLSEDSIISIMQEEKPNQKEKIILHEEHVGKYIPKTVPLAKREEYIIKALEYYAKAREIQAAKRERQLER